MEAGGDSSLIGVYGEIPGRDLFVHLVAVVPLGADKNDVARDALRGQGARPLGSDDFSTTGLVWDQFFDERAGNDVVTQYYNPEGDPTGGARIPLLATQSTRGQVAGSIFSFEDKGPLTDVHPLSSNVQGRRPSTVRTMLVGWRSEVVAHWE